MPTQKSNQHATPAGTYNMIDNTDNRLPSTDEPPHSCSLCAPIKEKLPDYRSCPFCDCDDDGEMITAELSELSAAKAALE